MADIGDQIIISGDSHFGEPGDLFETRLPKRLRDRAPGVTTTEAGEFWIIEHLEPAAIAGSMGAIYEDMAAAAKLGYAGAPKSVWDPAERLKEQDIDTVSAEVLYSSWGLFLFSLDDDEMRYECFKVFNDWAGEYCSYEPNRLKGLGLCDVTDPLKAVKQLEQIKEVGLSGALITDAPAEDRPYYHDDYEPLWTAAEELGLPISLHILTGSKGAGAIKYARTLPNGKPSPESRIHYVARIPMEVQLSLGYMIASGVFDRHPNLKIVMAEADIGWMPHFCYRMDHFGGGSKAGGQEQPTRAYFDRNIWATAQFEAETFKMAVDYFGANRFMWSSDYPHFDCEYPEDRALLGRILKHGFTDDEARWVLRDTAAELYGIDVSKLPQNAAV